MALDAPRLCLQGGGWWNRLGADRGADRGADAASAVRGVTAARVLLVVDAPRLCLQGGVWWKMLGADRGADAVSAVRGVVCRLG